MENLDKIEKLTKTATKIEEGLHKYQNVYPDKPSYYDKVGFGFNKDSRFAACEPIQLHFASWVGVYGDSGCSTIIFVDSEIFNNHLLKILNNDKEAILAKVAASIKTEAKTLKDKAKKELEEKLEKVNAL